METRQQSAQALFRSVKNLVSVKTMILLVGPVYDPGPVREPEGVRVKTYDRMPPPSLAEQFIGRNRVGQAVKAVNDGHRVTVATAGDEVLGWYWLTSQPYRDPWGYRVPVGDRESFAYDIAVKATRRRTGVAKLLAHHAMAESHEAGDQRIWGSAEPWNKASIGLCESWGIHPVQSAKLVLWRSHRGIEVPFSRRQLETDPSARISRPGDQRS